MQPLAPPTCLRAPPETPPPTPAPASTTEVATASASDAATSGATDAAARESPPRWLRCARCGQRITTTAERLLLEGSFEHERVNPAGFVHRFGCFRSAPGCASRGVPSRQATWFAGTFWQVQECAACAEHLGWLFFGAEVDFYGLILAALVEEDGPSGAS